MIDINKWQSLWNSLIYKWDLNKINTDYELFIDVSHWTHNSSFNEEKFAEQIEKKNLKGIIFKVSDATRDTGKLYLDDKAEVWYNLAQKYKLLTTGYHWLQPSVDPKIAYKYYDSWMKDHPCTLPYVVDFEEPSVVNASDYLWRLKTFLECGKPDSIIYTATGYISTLKSKITSSNWNKNFGFMSGYTLWVARYSRYCPKNLFPWKEDGWDLWQYSAKADYPFYSDGDGMDGREWGLPSGGLDMNWVKKSYLSQFTSGSNTITPEPEKETSFGIYTNRNMNVRNKPSTSGIIVDSLLENTRIKIKEIVGNSAWAKIDEEKFVCLTENGINYVNCKEE